jgi:subtilisin-like proprotein convertase family protein
MPGTVRKVTVRLSALTHTFPDDLDILLLGPQGQDVVLMSDVGGASNVVNVNLTFDQSATASLPDLDLITSGTYLPTNILFGDSFPAVGERQNATLEIFNLSNPNGRWSLYVVDDRTGDFGSIDGGWTLTVTSSE